MGDKATIDSKSFKLNLKTNDIDVTFSSQDKEVIPENPGHMKKKSSSQKKLWICHTSPISIDTV